jgi:hypothetical protein
MANYFGLIGEELSLYTLLKLDYKTFRKIEYAKIKKYNADYLVIIRNPDVCDKISNVLKRNDELNFYIYTSQDNYIWSVILIDIMNGYPFLDNFEGIGGHYINTDIYNPISLNVSSFVAIMSRFPNIYKYVGKYTEYPSGPYLFFRTIRNFKMNLVFNDDHKDELKEIKEFIDTGNIDGQLDLGINIITYTVDVISLLMMCHILLYALPKGKIKLRGEFVSEIDKFFRDEISEGYDNYSEYDKNRKFYDKLFGDLFNQLV